MEEADYPISVKCLCAVKHIWIVFPTLRSGSHQRAGPSGDVNRKAQENRDSDEHTALRGPTDVMEKRLGLTPTISTTINMWGEGPKPQNLFTKNYVLLLMEGGRGVLTLPLTVSRDRVTGGRWSDFSSICQPMTVMLPTRSLSADLQQATRFVKWWH